MLKKIYQAVITIIGCITGGVFYYLIVLLTNPDYQRGTWFVNSRDELGAMLLSIFLFGLLFNTVGPSIGRKSVNTTKSISLDLKDVSPRRLVTGTIGLIIGLIIALLISMLYRSVISSGWYSLLTIVLYIIMGYLGFAIAVSKESDLYEEITPSLSRRNGFGENFQIINKTKIFPEKYSAKILDTSVIIDGRIKGILEAGFLEGSVVIPEFVLVELRHIADSSDSLKRARGRRGLDVLKEMQEKYDVKIYNSDNMKSLEDIPEVDVKLIKLTKALNGRLITTDYNLNKVASINDIPVLNINDLANNIKPIVIPGEKMVVDIVKQGKDPVQGLAYLDDGTMIVVEDGRRFIGKTITITVTSVIQTSAGKMIFGKEQI